LVTSFDRPIETLQRKMNVSPFYLEPKLNQHILTDKFYFRPYREQWTTSDTLLKTTKEKESFQDVFTNETVLPEQSKELQPKKEKRTSKPRKKSFFFDYLTKQEGPWSFEEHERFLQGHKELGNQWAIIAKTYVLTRDSVIHFHFLKIL
jgi:hypothetical protein